MDDAPPSPKQLVPPTSGDRVVSQRPVAFRCLWCGEPVVELRYPGPLPSYGHACVAEARRHKDAAKAARRRGSAGPARAFTTSCKGSPTNLHGRALSAEEPDCVELVVRAPNESAAKAALALLQAQLSLDAAATPTPSTAGGWEVQLTLPLPAEQPAKPALPPSPSLPERSDDLFLNASELNERNVSPYLTEEIASEVRLVESSRFALRGILQDIAATKSIGVRLGAELIKELEDLTWRIANLSVQQAMTTRGITTSTDAEPIVREAAYARARAEFPLYALRDKLDASAIRERLEAIDRTNLVGRRDYALLTVFLATGRRLAEVTALTMADLTIQGERVQLVFRRAKGGKVLRDQLGAGTSAALLDWLRACYGEDLAGVAGDKPVWVSLARNGTKGLALSTRAIGLMCEARIGTSKVHSLRHTFAHAMEGAGAKVSDIQARLGHSNLATTGRYLAALRAAENPQSDALEALFGVGQHI